MVLKQDISLWAGVIAAPLIWAGQFQLEYMLVPWLCTTGRTWVAHLIFALAFLLALACTFLCWRQWRAFTAGQQAAPPDAIPRPHFSGLLGVMSAALFTLLIVANHIGIFFLSPCWD
jgi:hypothetical protein